jgi:dihydropteroate synthase
LYKITERRPEICGISFDSPTIMGILNVTPDSFSDGGKYSTLKAAIEHCVAMVSAGADIIDIGGESTRPGAAELDVAQEISRVIPVLDNVAKEIQVPISIDTRKSEVAKLAISSGAVIVNDVSGLTFDSKMAEYCINQNLPVCIMHSQGIPKTMQNAPKYQNVCLDIYDFLNEQIEKMVDFGMQRRNIIVDPGIGFGKTLTHNLDLLKRISLFHGLGVPILIGVSRKKFIKTVAGLKENEDRMPGSIALALFARSQGIQIFRVHDVKETVQAMKLWHSVYSYLPGELNVS